MRPGMEALLRSVRRGSAEGAGDKFEALSSGLPDKIVSRRASVLRRRRHARTAWTQTTLVAAVLCLLFAGTLGSSVKSHQVESVALAWLNSSPMMVDRTESE